MLRLLVTLAALLCWAEGAVPSLGACNPNIRGISYFDKSRYLGVWYEYANVFEPFQIGSKCVRATYTDLGNRIGVFNEQINTITGSYGNVKGSARQVTNFADLAVGFEGIPFAGNQGGTPNYSVVETDYNNYVIVYNCNNFPFIKLESLWLLTRQQYPPQSLVKFAYGRMRQLGLPVNSLEVTEQTGCQALPPPGSKQFQLSVESFGK